MLETRAVIVRIEGRHALVQASQTSSCEHCSGKGCGADKLSRMFCSKPRLFQVENPVNAGVGDEVIILIAEGSILRGIALIYLLPLLLLATGAMLGSRWAELPGQRDGYAAAGALFGLAAGFAIARWISSFRDRNQSGAVIARQCGEE